MGFYHEISMTDQTHVLTLIGMVITQHLGDLNDLEDWLIIRIFQSV